MNCCVRAARGRTNGLLSRADDATAFFESGGEVEPSAAPPPPPPMPKPSAEVLKKWFPQYKPVATPRFRVVCFHNAGSAASTYTGTRTGENPLVSHCEQKGGELLALELPGREMRRNEPRERKLRPYVEALYPVLAPLLQEAIPYVVIGHSMGTWLSYGARRRSSAPLFSFLVFSARLCSFASLTRGARGAAGGAQSSSRSSRRRASPSRSSGSSAASRAQPSR